MKLDAIALDEQIIEHGRRDEWPDDPGIVVWTKRALTPEWHALYQGAIADCDADPETGGPSAADMAHAILVATTTVCFVRWEGVQGKIVEGNYVSCEDVLEYTPEVGMALFDPKKTRRWEHFFGWWSGIAQIRKNFRMHQVALSAKKPGSSSDGNSPTENTSDST